jgi:hypothetical protein
VLWEADRHYKEQAVFAAVDRDKAARLRKEQAKLDKQLNDFSHQVKTYVAGVLVAAGYRQHDRGEWRKRRMSEKTEIQPAPPQQRAEALNALARSTLTILMNSGGLTEQTQTHMHADLCALRSALGWESSSPVERLFIESICLNWTRLQFSDQFLSANSASKNYNQKTVAYLEARLSMAPPALFVGGAGAGQGAPAER